MQKLLSVTFAVMQWMSTKNKKNGDMTEDDLRNAEKDIQTLTDDNIKAIDSIVAEKEKDC